MPMEGYRINAEKAPGTTFDGKRRLKKRPSLPAFTGMEE